MAKSNRLLNIDKIKYWKRDYFLLRRCLLLSLTVLLIGCCLIYLYIWWLGGDKTTLNLVLRASVGACVTFFLMFILFVFLSGFKGTSLHYAAFCGRKKTIERFIAKGMDVNVKIRSGWTPLHDAAVSGYADIVKILLENGAVCTAADKFGSTPLHIAAFCGHKELVELLLAAGADVNAKTTKGDTPLSAVIHEAPKVTPKYDKHKGMLGEKRLGEVAELLRKHGGSE